VLSKQLILMHFEYHGFFFNAGSGGVFARQLMPPTEGFCEYSLRTSWQEE